MRHKPAFDSETKQEEIHHVTLVFDTCNKSMLQIIQTVKIKLCLCFHWILYCNVLLKFSPKYLNP